MKIKILFFCSILIFGNLLINCSGSKKTLNKVFKKEHRRNVKEPDRGDFIWPAEGKIASRFGNRRGKNHDGLDIIGAKGDKIKAAAKGEVIFSGWGPKGYGKIIIIKHSDDIVTIYAHNDYNYVSKGENVRKGKTIGLIGKTGRASSYHLHFEIRSGTTPLDPLKYLPKR